MKKSLQRLLSVAALLILAIGGSWLHAETVTVCDGTATNSLVPVYGSWVDTQGATSEFVIPASTEGMDEMVSGSISKLSFYLSSVAAAEWNATIQVYLAEVENTTLSGVVGPSACTVVYTGVLSATASPMEIEFDSPYTYEGGNLLIGTYVQTAGTWKATTFVGISASGAGYHSHGTTNTAVSFIPKTTFEYEPGGAVSCEKPVDFVVANVASHSADLSWSSSASSFELVLSTEGANDVISVVTDTFTTLSNLSDNTAYTVSVRAICQVGDSSRIVKKSFTTPCDPLAILMLTEGFEDVDNTLGCWRKTGGGTLGVSTSTSNIHAGAQSLSMNGGAPASPMYLVLPQVDATLLTSARLRFWYKQSSTGATYPHFTIGSMSDPGDTSTFVAIKELDRTSTFTEAVADFNEIPAGHTYMVIKFAGGTYSTYGYIDDVEILPMPDCMEPGTPNVLSVGTNEATLSWSPRGEEEMWQYLCIPSNQTPDWENFELAEDTIIELEGLLSNMAYTFYVKADCGDGLSEESSVSFKTPCQVVSAINWTEDFEDYPTGSSSVGPDCWNILDANGSTRPFVYITNTHTPLGEKSLFLETNTSKAGYALFPNMLDVQNVQISFSFKYESASSGGDLHFGYLLDAADQNSFVSLTTCAHSSNAWTRSEKVALNGVPSGASIAFKLDASPTSYYYAMVDSIVMEDLPNCLKPVNLNVLNIDANSASVVWSAGSVESQYALVEEGDSLVWDDQNVVIVDSLALSNLNPNTSYTFYVRAYCSQGEQSDSALISFHTECLPIDSLPWSENFDELATGSSTSEAPYCWDILDANGASRPYVYVFAGTSYNSPLGVKSLFLETQASTRGAAFAILPKLTRQSEAQISFSYKYESATAGGDLHFGYITNINDTSSFVSLATCARSTAWANAEDIMLNVVPSGALLAFKLDVPSSSYYYAMVDNILLEELPSCLKPINLSVDSVSQESAIITWDAGASETLWQYALVAAGDSLVWDDENIVITDSVALIGLDANSAYTFYVRAYCSAEGSSEPAKVVFVTECAEINAIPYAEDFEGDGFDCWYVGNMQSTSSSYIPSVGTSYKYEGTKGLRLNAYSYVSSYSASYNTEADSALAILPALDYVGGIQQYRVQFYAKAGGTTVSSSTNYNQNLYVGIVDDSFSNFTLVEAVTMNGSTFTDFQVNLSNFNGIGGHIAFLAAVDTASTASTRYGQFYIDNVRVSLIPSCTRPDSLQITNLVQDTVAFTWQAGGTETQWQWVVAEEDAEPDWANAVITNVPQVELNDWDANTNYNFYVRAYCSAQDQSEEAVASFYFGYCQPAPTSVDGQGITGVAFAGVTPDGEIHKTTATGPLYANNSAISFEVPAATEALVSVTYGTGYSYGTVIWVDWNNDFEFDESEIVYTGMSTNANPTTLDCAFTVPATTPEGSYRMRIGGGDSFFDSFINQTSATATANPCSNSTYLTYEDYTLVVTAAPNCLQPINLSIVELTANYVELGWEAAITTTPYQFALVAEGDTLVWNQLNLSLDTVGFGDLTANSDYTFYVRAYCSDQDQSSAAMISFHTPCAAIVGLPWAEDFDSLATGSTSAVAPECWNILGANNGSYPYVYVTATHTPLGAKSLFLESNNSGPAYAVLPQLEDLSNAQISFSYKYESATAGGDLLFGYMTSPADETTFVALTTCARSTAWANVEELALTSVPAGAALAFKLNAPSYSYYYAMVDEILISELPNCQKPTDLILADLSETGAAIAWAGHGNELGWNWICCLDTVEPDWTAFNTVDSALAVIDNLQPNTNYIFYVKAACGEADFSDVVSLSFYTGYCLPAPSSVDGSGITAIAFGGTVVDNAAHASSAPFFTDNTAIAYEVAAGANAQIDITYQTGYSYGTVIWVDWNHNLMFEENEVVFTGTSLQVALDTISCSFAVPAAQELGAYRMRIGGADSFFDSFISGSAAYQDDYSCSNGTYRLYEDYTLQVTNGPSTDIWAIFGDTENNGVKFIREGHIYILRNGIIYDATGRKVEER